MKFIRRILFPIDFSRRSQAVLPYACCLSQALDAELVLVHCVYPKTYFISNDLHSDHIDIEEWHKESIKSLAVLQSELLRNHPKLKCSYLTGRGHIKEVLLRLAENEHIDLIVLPSHKKPVWQSAFSTIDYICQHSFIPCLTIPTHFTYQNIKRIAYASDLMEESPELIDFTVKLAGFFNAGLDVIHVSATDTQAHIAHCRKELEKLVYLYDSKQIACHVLVSDSTEDSLQEYVKKESIDLLILAAYHKNFLEKIITHPYVSHLVASAALPLLILPKLEANTVLKTSYNA